MTSSEPIALPWWCDFTAGLLGGSTGTLVGQPLDTLKTRVQVLRSGFCPSAYLKEGLHSPAATVKDLYKGISGPLLGAALINGIVFATEEMVCNTLESHSATSHMVAGAVAGGAQSI